MRIAICFWGLCRSTQFTVQSYKENILKPLLDAGFEIDVYLHTFQLFRPYNNPRAEEHDIQLLNTNYKLLGATMTMVENQDVVDKSLCFDAYKTHGNPWVQDTQIPSWETFHNQIRALWSLKQVTYLWSLTGKAYNRVIYLRPDVKFLTPFKLDWLDCNPAQICIPDFQCIDNCNDRFAIGWPHVMKVYGNRFDSALHYSKTHPLHSETFLAHILKTNTISLRHIPIRFQRIRATGNICPTDMKLLL